MEIVYVKEKWTNPINTVTIGATQEQGGTRTSTITVGGETTLPLLTFEGEIPNRPAVAGIVVDVVPETWPDVLKKAIGDEINSPAEWAQKCVEDFKVDLISLELLGAYPSGANRSPAEAAETVKAVLEAVGVPLIIWGCRDEEKDNEVLPECSHAARGENCLIGPTTETNYRTLGAIGKADKHKLIGEAPVDINIAKQVNILVSDMDFPLSRIVMFQATGALGYGIEYAYSIQERERLAALTGDKMMAMPVICDEAKSADEEAPQWGPAVSRGPMWEAATAITLLQSGADIIRMRHPKAVSVVKKLVDELFA